MRTNSEILMEKQPSLSVLETWATPRLLRFFKARRKDSIRFGPHYDEIPEKGWDRLHDYVNQIQKILNKREHVSK